MSGAWQVGRGKRGQQKRLQRKYADQDEEDRALALELLGLIKPPTPDIASTPDTAGDASENSATLAMKALTDDVDAALQALDPTVSPRYETSRDVDSSVWNVHSVSSVRCVVGQLR